MFNSRYPTEPSDDWFAAQGAPRLPNYGLPAGQGAGEAITERPWGSLEEYLAAHPEVRGSGLAPRGGFDPSAIVTAARQASGGYQVPGSAPTGGGGGGPQGEAIIRQWQATHAPTEPLTGLIAALQAAGIDAKPYLYGSTASANEIDLPGWGKYKVKGGENSSSPFWYFGGPDSAEDGGGGYGGGAGGGYGMLSGQPGDLTQIAAKALETSPGFQFRLGEGMKALERSAAAKGTLLTGGTLKGLTRYAQDYASNEYGNQYARLFGEQGQRYNQLFGLSNLGLQAAGQQANTGSSYANLYGDLTRSQATGGQDLITQGANAQAAGTVGGAGAGLNAASQGLNQALQLWLLSQIGNGGGLNEPGLGNLEAWRRTQQSYPY
jgi:hypothetical protein